MTENRFWMKKNRKGFTLAEVLIALAIIIVLLALGIAAIFSIQKNIRQRKLDDIAQEIYMVAQDEMLGVRYTGQLAAFNQVETVNGVNTLGYIPADSNVDSEITNGLVKINYITLADLDTANIVLPADSVDGDIRNAHWVIEYDSISGNVYSVFYSEKVNFTVPRDAAADSDFVNNAKYAGVTYDDLRDNKDGSSNAGIRKSKAGGYIGYYGCGGVWVAEAKELDINATVNNAEELTLILSYNEPVLKSEADGSSVADPIESIELTVADLDQTDLSGNPKTWTLPITATGSGVNTTFTATNNILLKPVAVPKPTLDATTNRLETGIVLDSILQDKGFEDITGLEVGDNITITVKITTKSGIIGQTEIDTNSGFESKEKVSGQDEVHVSYGRHLQNLDDYDTTNDFDVKQTKDIIFSEVVGDDTTWYAKYYKDNAITFVPVTNGNMQTFDGQNFNIQGMRIKRADDNNNVGMFGTFTGTLLTNIRMIDSQIQAPSTANAVGTIAGQTNALTTLENCYSYLSSDFAASVAANTYDITKVNYVVTGGKQVGSLVGNVIGSSALTVTNCFGSTSLAGDSSASEVGGLFGYVATGKVKIEKSYTDCYLKGTRTAGLVGSIPANQGLEIKSCYAAGFTYTYGDSAGFVFSKDLNDDGSANPNNNLQISNSYSILSQNIYSTIEKTYFITNVPRPVVNDTVFYSGTVPDEKNQGTPSTNMHKATFISQVQGGFVFPGTDSTTYAYNLIDNGLTEDYQFPVILDWNYADNKGKAEADVVKKLDHYGDWKAEFSKGLVYYEKYSDNTIGFYGSNTSLLKNDKTVVADGYAYALSEEDYKLINGNPEVSVTFTGDYTLENTDDSDKETVTYDDSMYILDPDTKAKYILVPLDALIDRKIGENPLEESFYYAIRIDDDVYYFNPFFAKTVKSVTAEKSLTTDGKTLTEADLKNAQATKSKIRTSVRTARQLHELSENTIYWTWEYMGFVQEIDIDFTAYKGYIEVNKGANKVVNNTPGSYVFSNIFTEVDFGKGSEKMSLQKPIGNADIAFKAQYDGSGCQITGVHFIAAAEQKKTTTIGLFGNNEGVIKNVTLNGNLTVDGKAVNNAYGYTNSNVSASRTVVRMGALVGHNGTAGVIDNCAVTGYRPASRITSTSYSTTIQTYQNSYLYIGGIVGSNDGSISKCSSDVPEIRVSSSSAYVYGGSFTGYNKGIISTSYAFARLYGTLDTSLSAYYGGFAGWNTGKIENAYCASSVTVGDRANKYAFANNRGTLRNCVFLDNVDGSYYGKVYAYMAGDKGAATPVTSFEALQNKSISGFGKAAATYLNTYNKGKNFPYPAVVERNGQKVCIGNWPTTADLGEVGVIYWEHEVGGSNEGWYFSTVNSLDEEASTLCDEHDDGGVVTEYGYGYFYEKKSDPSYTDGKSWDIEYVDYLNINLDNAANSAEENTTAAEHLAVSMPNYGFVVYTSGTAAKELKLKESDGRKVKQINLARTDPAKAVAGYPTSTNGISTKDEYTDAPANQTNNPGNGWKKTVTEREEAAPVPAEPSEEQLDQSIVTTTTTTTYYKSTNRPAGTAGVDYTVEDIDNNDGRVTFGYSGTNSIASSNNRNNNYSNITFTMSGAPDTVSVAVSSTISHRVNSSGTTYYFALKRVTSGSYDVIITSNVGTETTYWKFGYAKNDGTGFVNINNLGTGANRINNSARYYKKYRNSTVTMTYNKSASTHTYYYYWKNVNTNKTEVVKHYRVDTAIIGAGGYAPNGIITLASLDKNAGEETNQSFVINPFFGDSLAHVTDENPISVETLGTTEDTEYSIRNTKQLQFINWNAVAKNTSSKTGSEDGVNGSQTNINKNFLYLKYVSASQSVSDWDYNFYWKQSHDIGSESIDFTPIGCLFDSAGGKNYQSVSYVAFFGGQYDGNQYEIRNLNILSNGRQCTGLFGVTMGANLKNIIMYSSTGENYVQNMANDENWYTIGGLVGFATIGQSTKSAISNCAIAGYQIIDNRDSSHPGNNGGADVGGLVGATNMPISGCSAVTNIKIDAQYNSGYCSIRVGGLVGCLRNSMSNCYSGGSIVLGDNLKGALGKYNSYSTIDGDAGSHSCIWIGGLSGGLYMKVYGMEEIVGPAGRADDNSPDEQPVVSNCYTYMELPEAGSYLVRDVQTFASVGEFLKGGSGGFSTSDNQTGHGKVPFGTNVTIRNCYAYGVNASGNNDYASFGRDTNWRATKVRQGTGTTGSDRTITIDNTATRSSAYLGYTDMADSNKLKTWLGDAFKMVTVVEDGVPVNGKYSFPSSSVLNGKNYPFPTILTQTNDGATYNVHYGDWPNSGVIVRQSDTLVDNTLEIDVLTEPTATFVVELRDTGVDELIAVSDDDTIAKVDSVVKNADGTYTVTVTGHSEGAASITLKSGIYEAYVTVVVNVEMQLITPESVVAYAGRTKDNILADWVDENDVQKTLKAVNTEGVELTGGTWHVLTQDTNNITVIETEVSGETVYGITVENVPSSDSSQLVIEYTYVVGQDTEGNDIEVTAGQIVPIEIIMPEEINLGEAVITGGIVDADPAIAIAPYPYNVTAADFATLVSDLTFNEYTWSTGVYLNSDYTNPTDSLVNVAFDPDASTLSVTAKDYMNSTLPDTDVYIRIYGTKNETGRSVMITVKLTVINHRETWEQLGLGGTPTPEPEPEPTPGE